MITAWAERGARVAGWTILTAIHSTRRGNRAVALAPTHIGARVRHPGQIDHQQHAAAYACSQLVRLSTRPGERPTNRLLHQRTHSTMPLSCTPEVAAALTSIDALRALHEGPDGPIDLSQRYSTYGDRDDVEDWTIEDEDNPSLIFFVCHSGNAAVVRYIAEHLIADVKDPHIFNVHGYTPIWIAAASGHESCIRALVEFGGDPNLADNFRRSPCHIAAQEGHESCVRALCELGADAGIRSTMGTRMETPCSIAAEMEHQSIVDFLTNVLAQEANLHTAAAGGNAPLVWQLVRNHTNMVTDNVHAADLAAANGHAALARQLRSLWTQVSAHAGYRRYAQHLTAQRIRWAALRTRFLTSDLRKNFNTAPITSADRSLFFFIGTSRTVGLCPDDIYGVIMGFWSDTQ